MKKVIVPVMVAFGLFSGSCKNSCCQAPSGKSNNTEQNFAMDTTKLRSGEIFYQCPMDQEVISDQKGSCPKCGMDLIEMKKH